MQIASGLDVSFDIDLSKDINNDNKIGLEEAIFSLQVIGGLRPEYTDSDLDGYSELQGDCDVGCPKR